MLSKSTGRSPRVFTIELIRGASWQEPVATIDRRNCLTNSIEFAVAEAKYWLAQTQKSLPQRGATHYRVIGEAGTIVGGPP
jgi:hypothetical protein